VAQFTTRPCNRFEVRAAPALLPTLFPSPTGSRLSPSSSHGAIHVMAQTGRSNVRYVDPQRRYTLVLGPSWNAPIGALPHDDRAGTHDSADGQCGSYASTGHGQAATNIFRRYPQRVCQGLLRCGISSRLLTAVGQIPNWHQAALCQLRPATDIAVHEPMYEKCQEDAANRAPIRLFRPPAQAAWEARRFQALSQS